jgi:YbgC/YbaW family acyl-CoA thioester hydrolase
MTQNAPHVVAGRMVVLGDVDAAAVLYFATVFRWHEEVFTRWLSAAGFPLGDLFASGRGLPVRSSWAEYPASAKLGEILSATASITALRDTEFVFTTEWRSDDTDRTVVTVSTKHVSCVKDADSGYFVRADVWPQLREQLQHLETDGLDAQKDEKER